MRLNYLLIPLTIGFIGVTVFNIASHLKDRELTESGAAESQTSIPTPDDISEENSIIAQSTSLLMTGVSSKVPTTEDYTPLSTVPWEIKDINRLFRSAGTVHACQLLEPGIDVVQPLSRGTKGQASPLGRRSVFGLRLQLGKAIGNGLPGISRGYIEDYLRSHQLLIQPLFYQDEKGALVLGVELRAALYKIDGPFLTALHEDMIKSSVGDFRVLGAYWQGGEQLTPSAVRTLILAFHYERDSDRGGIQPTPQREFELIFLHLLKDATPADPKVAVFATSDGRSQFHLLEETDPDQPEQIANVTADIRFADAQLLGMLPRLPVVTRVKHRALLSIPIETVKAEIAGLPGKPPEHGLSTVLDDFHARAHGLDGLQDDGKEKDPDEDKTSKPDVVADPVESEDPGEKKSEINAKEAGFRNDSDASPQDSKQNQKRKQSRKTGFDV
jgi:hypothetical protein